MTIFIALSLVLSLAMVAFIGRPLVAGGADAGSKRYMRFAGLLAIGLAPVVAAILYTQIGSPAALDQTDAAPSVSGPAAGDQSAEIAAMAPEERNAMIENMVQGLAARLAVDGNDLGGWRMLGRSYGVLGRHVEAADAWREALVLSEGAVDDWRGLAVALVESRDVNAAPAIKEAFEEVLLQAPGDPMALYFLGHAAMSDGDSVRAAQLWTELRAQTPDTAPLAGELDGLLAQARGEGAAPAQQ